MNNSSTPDLKNLFKGKIDMVKPIIANILNGVNKQIVERCSNPQNREDLQDVMDKIEKFGEDAFFRFIFISKAQELIQSVLNLFADDFKEGKGRLPFTYQWLFNKNQELVTNMDRNYQFGMMNAWKTNFTGLHTMMQEGNPNFWKQVQTKEWGTMIKVLKFEELWNDRGILKEDRVWILDTLSQLYEISDIIDIISPVIRKRIEGFCISLFKEAIKGTGIQVDTVMAQIEGLFLESFKDKNIDVLEIFQKLIKVIGTLSHLFSGNNLIPQKFVKILSDFQKTTATAKDENQLIENCQNIIKNTNIQELASDPETKSIMESFNLGDILNMYVGKPNDLL